MKSKSKFANNLKIDTIALWHSLFRGMASADRLIQSPEGNKDNEDIVQTMHQGGVFNDMLEGVETQQVVEMRDKYLDVITKGTFIQLDKKGDKNDQIITYARHLNGKTLLVVANKNVNRSMACKISIPTLKSTQELKNLLPSYGQESKFQVHDNELCVDLGPARVHVFEIDTPNIENYCDKIYKQNI